MYFVTRRSSSFHIVFSKGTQGENVMPLAPDLSIFGGALAALSTNNFFIALGFLFRCYCKITVIDIPFHHPGPVERRKPCHYRYGRRRLAAFCPLPTILEKLSLLIVWQLWATRTLFKIFSFVFSKNYLENHSCSLDGQFSYKRNLLNLKLTNSPFHAIKNKNRNHSIN